MIQTLLIFQSTGKSGVLAKILFDYCLGMNVRFQPLTLYICSCHANELKVERRDIAMLVISCLESETKEFKLAARSTICRVIIGQETFSLFKCLVYVEYCANNFYSKCVTGAIENAD
ncbi:CLUMA_CG008854, isoform A [Clunio marinus]|uniref:CLUMA_CG008854, isoform A n=1 Tax=Clunio marinus TaxID=568069 RepID=A0A1J1I4M8_9DIPT|nr:CLUMA_CG008854, isoform A [Clunio marinus]